MTFLERIMQSRFPDARVYRNAHNNDWTVSIQVSGSEARSAHAGDGQVEFARKLIAKLDPPNRHRRLHWGKKK
jgi:hypothetical protein